MAPPPAVGDGTALSKLITDPDGDDPGPHTAGDPDAHDPGPHAITSTPGDSDIEPDGDRLAASCPDRVAEPVEPTMTVR